MPRSTPSPGFRPLVIVALYSATVFIGAFLLFVVQPQFARLVLPLLGGSPAVWNTALVCYQLALLAGYGYAHFSASRLGPRGQVGLHLLVVAVAFVVLPIALPAGAMPSGDADPTFWLIGLMARTIGLPFFAVAATNPLMQRWFASSGHERAPDPYFLSVASNAGSLLALLAYPILIEPYLRLTQQSHAWSWGYGLLAVFLVGCAAVRWRPADAVNPVAPTASKERSSPRVADRLRWVFLSLVPSSLLSGVTTYLSSEVAVVPMLWVVPLALYLLTFMFAFAPRPWFPPSLLERLLPVLIVALVLVLNMQATEPMPVLMGLHLLAFLVVALLSHRRLAEARPAAEHLTEFYLWMSVGGVLGGAFNALVAPVIFNSVAEYPLMLVAGCLAALPGSGQVRRGDWLWPIGLAVVTAGLVWATAQTPGRYPPGLVFGPLALTAYFLSKRPLRFALAVGALLLAGSFWRDEKGRPLYAERTFFGVNRVMFDPVNHRHLLLHGRTLHGMENVDRLLHPPEPLTYYHRSGPAGQLLSLYAQKPSANIALVGLGAGSLASYAQPGQTWTCFEIDPDVAKVAGDENFFTFLHDARAPVRIVLGDARLMLGTHTGPRFDLLVIDAYSSDAIPVHLVTREALMLYLSRVTSDGVLAFHISNLHLDLEPVFVNLAHDAGLAAWVRDDTAVSTEEVARGKSPSVWLVMTRDPAGVPGLTDDKRWRPGRGDGHPVWTDDYSSLLSVFRWR